MNELVDYWYDWEDEEYLLYFLTRRIIADYCWLGVTRIDRHNEKHFDYWSQLIPDIADFLHELIQSPYYFYFVYFGLTIDSTTLIDEMVKRKLYSVDAYNIADFVIDRTIFLLRKDLLLLRKTVCIIKEFT